MRDNLHLDDADLERRKRIAQLIRGEVSYFDHHVLAYRQRRRMRLILKGTPKVVQALMEAEVQSEYTREITRRG